MKKEFSLLTSLIMVISLVGVMPAMSVGALESGDYEYEILDDGTVEITDYNGSATNLTIPSTIGGKTVTSIGDWAFWYCESLTSITIPDSVTSIGEWAFSDCFSLTSVTIGNSVTSIGKNAFDYCYSLENMYFNGTADDWAKIIFGYYDSNPMYYAENEYFNNELITDVVLSDDITTINDYAFYDCDSLTSIIIPDNVTSIGNSAFFDCASLISVTIGNGITKIDDYAFKWCSALKTITIPSSVTSIGEDVFLDCDNLDNMYYTGTADDWIKIAFVDKASNPMVYAENEYFNNELITDVVLSDDITAINDYAFAGCNLINITIPGNVTSISNGVFSSCEGLTSITIPDNVTSIGYQAFYGCDSLTSITIPDSVTSIGSYAFAYCESLTSINVNANNKYYSSVDGVLFNKNKTELIQYPIGNKRNSYTIPDSVTSIGYDAFALCNSLTSVTIPDSVTSIGDYAFSDCDSLTSITIPDSVTSIGEYAFAWCESLTSVTIPESVTSIGDNAFWDCESLTSITIPDSVTSIGEDAFAFCDSLTSITIPDSVTSIGFRAFYGCDSLTIKCYANSTAHQYAIDNDIPYELLPDKTQLEGKVYCQFKDNNTMMRFIAEVDIEDVTNANSGEITVFYNEEVLEVKSITGAYKSLYAGGQVITAPEGKCYIISNQYTGFMYDDMMSVEFTLDNYDIGLSRDVIIE